MDTNMIKEIIEEAVTKRDRSVSIYFSPETGMSVSVYPWPDAEACSEMLKRGEITMTDYRLKMGLPNVKQETLYKLLEADRVYQGGVVCTGDTCDINLHAVDPSNWGDEK